MKQEPTFSLYRYTLGDDNQAYLGADVGIYAHTVVMTFFDESIFSSKSPSTLPVEAIVALNVWGEVIHHLHQAVENCQNGNYTTIPIDIAAAYWLGSLQQAGDASTGYLLYALAEVGGDMFGQAVDSGQSKANANILELLKQAAIHLQFRDTCANLRVTINALISQMTAVLIQHLIANLKVQDQDRVKIFSNAVVPLLSDCNPSVFSFLKKKLITSSYTSGDVNDIINALQSTYSCLGLTCDDIGVYQQDLAMKCVDTPDLSPLAGYIPSSDVSEVRFLNGCEIPHSLLLFVAYCNTCLFSLYTDFEV